MFPPWEKFFPALFFRTEMIRFFRGQYREKKGGVSSAEKQAGVGFPSRPLAAGIDLKRQKVEPDLIMSYSKTTV
jgi:hypothetical protein